MIFHIVMTQHRVFACKAIKDIDHTIRRLLEWRGTGQRGIGADAAVAQSHRACKLYCPSGGADQVRHETVGPMYGPSAQSASRVTRTAGKE